MTHYDAIIIGAGQAGFPLAGALTELGWHVALVEGRALGGTCVNDGCTPTKTIIASARAAHLARRGADFGVQTGPVSVDFARVMARKNAIVEQYRGGIESWLGGIDNLTIYEAYATFEGPHRVRAGDALLESERIYINTGAHPFIPPIPGLDRVPYLDSTSILELTALPQHLIILGGGYIGLEFAQAFRRFGSEVTIIEASPQIMAREDADIAQAAQGILEAEQVRILVNTRALQVAEQHGQVAVTVDQEGTSRIITGSHLLVATGRRPNSDRLGLERAGIETDRRGYIVVDGHLRTSVEGVWALGDVNGQGAFTHTSWNDYEIVLDNIKGGSRKVSDRIPTYGLFIDPPLGRVGMSERAVRESGRPALIGVKPMSRISRAIERDETQGLMKVLVDAETKQFLGAAILGIGGDEIIHTITDLMAAGAPYTVMQHAVHIHPTVSELLPTLLGELEPLETQEVVAT